MGLSRELCKMLHNSKPPFFLSIEHYQHYQHYQMVKKYGILSQLSKKKKLVSEFSGRLSGRKATWNPASDSQRKPPVLTAPPQYLSSLSTVLNERELAGTDAPTRPIFFQQRASRPLDFSEFEVWTHLVAPDPKSWGLLCSPFSKFLTLLWFNVPGPGGQPKNYPCRNLRLFASTDDIRDTMIQYAIRYYPQFTPDNVVTAGTTCVEFDQLSADLTACLANNSTLYLAPDHVLLERWFVCLAENRAPVQIQEDNVPTLLEYTPTPVAEPSAPAVEVGPGGQGSLSPIDPSAGFSINPNYNATQYSSMFVHIPAGCRIEKDATHLLWSKYPHLEARVLVLSLSETILLSKKWLGFDTNGHIEYRDVQFEPVSRAERSTVRWFMERGTAFLGGTLFPFTLQGEYLGFVDEIPGSSFYYSKIWYYGSGSMQSIDLFSLFGSIFGGVVP